MDASAKAFVDAILDSKAGLASQMMVSDARNKAVVTDGMNVVSNYLHQTGPFADLKLEHTYLPKASGSGSDTMIVCGPNSGTDWVSVQTTPGASQAYVVLSAKTVNNDWAFVLWLERETDVWRVRNFDVTPASIVGHTPDDLLKLAREQRDRGNMFNAQMLYIATGFTANRGEPFQLGIAQALKADLQKFTAPTEFHEKSWTLDGTVFSVNQATVLGVDRQIGLTFDLPMEHWTDDKDADQHNHAFLDAFRSAHPEYSQAFGFLVARAMKPDNSGGFSTVYDAKRGYL